MDYKGRDEEDTQIFFSRELRPHEKYAIKVLILDVRVRDDFYSQGDADYFYKKKK